MFPAPCNKCGRIVVIAGDIQVAFGVFLHAGRFFRSAPSEEPREKVVSDVIKHVIVRECPASGVGRRLCPFSRAIRPIDSKNGAKVDSENYSRLGKRALIWSAIDLAIGISRAHARRAR